MAHYAFALAGNALHATLLEKGGVTAEEKDMLMQHKIQRSPPSCGDAGVAVAVCKDENSRHAVKWALQKLVAKGDRILLLHVRPPTVYIPTPIGSFIPISQVCSDAVDVYMKEVEAETANLLKPFQHLCKNKKVQTEIVVLEDDNIPNAILKYVSNSSINKLVMGSSSRNAITRKLKGFDVPANVARKAPKFCSVYVISKGKLTSVHSNILPVHDCDSVDDLRNCSSGSPSSQESIVSREETTSEFYKSTTFQSQEESKKVEEAKVREELAIAMAAEYKANCDAVMTEIEAATKDSVNEIEQGRDAELKAIRDSSDRKEVQDTFQSAEQRYRKYSIKEIVSATDNFSESLEIGEGGYGPVYKCTLDHISVAIKVLRTDAVRGRHEFQQEVEILSRIHHPNMVLLLGACPERGCLVYEYMANGSLEDRLFRKDASASLPWFVRFRIASEIASALLFLHSNKPEPIVHRDLKPANILLDQNFVSKIADVGLARLVPPEISSTLTEYKNTLLGGTFFYMDPEYIRTGTLRPKSDLYALGIILLQLLTAKTAMAIPEVVESAIQNGSLRAILDKSAGEWPLEEATDLAKLALKCTELRRRDRPDLETVVLPELERFKDVANSHVQLRNVQRAIAPPSYFICPILQAVMEDPYIAADGITYEYKAIKEWLEKHNSPPMGDPKLSQKHLIPNRSLRSAILEWRLESEALPLTKTLIKGRK